MNYQVEIISGRTKEPLLTTNYQGRRFAVVEEEDMNCPFAIRVKNMTYGDALAVVSVDGCSVLTGENASKDDGGYILSSMQHYDIQGWRRGNDAVAEFVFTGLGKTYAELTGRPDNVGVIGAVFYKRFERPRPVFRSPQYDTKYQMKSATSRGGLEYCSAIDNGVGTGYGQEKADHVNEATFVRSKDAPTTFVIYYNTRKQLEALGIPVPVRFDMPNPFPADNKVKGPFVPAP